MRAPRRFSEADGKAFKMRVVYSAGCQKYTYPSKKQAKSHAALSRRASGETLLAYHCDACHGWHIGHPIGLNGRKT